MKVCFRLVAMVAALLLFSTDPASAADLSAQALPYPVVFVGNTEVDLSWGANSNADFLYYRVLRNGAEIARIADAQTTFYRDSERPAGQTYQYSLCVARSGVAESCAGGGSITTSQVEGIVYRDLTWSAGTYTMKAQVYVQLGATLTIPAATTVRSATAGTAVTLSAALSDPAKRGVIRVDGATLRDIGLVLGPGSSLQNGTVTGGSVTARFYDPGSVVVSGTQFTNSRVQVLPPEVPASVSVTGNTFRTQEPFSGTTFVQVSDTIATIEGNQFYLGPPSTRPHTAITLLGNCGTATVRDNYLQVTPTAYTSVGMMLSTSPACAVSVTGNVVKDFVYGIQALPDVTGTIAGNTLRTTSASIEVRGNSPVKVNQNCLVSSTTSSTFRGLLITDTSPSRTTALDARNNWWGHNTGPYYATDNPTGEGSRIQAASGKVLFSPWLTTSNCVDSVPVPKNVAVEVTGDPQIANGLNTLPLTARVLNQEGGPFAGATVAFSLSPQLGTLSATTATTGADGRATVQYTVPPESALGGQSRVVVAVTAAVGSIRGSGNITLVPVPCVRVQNSSGINIAGAEVFVNNTLVGETDAQGKLCTMMDLDDALVAREMVLQQPSLKGAHDQDSDANWAFRAYRTSMDRDAKGEPAPFIVADVGREQVLVLRETNPLFGFNIVVSVEWETTAEYMRDLRQAFASASQYLYDVTNGQMLFERVTIYEHGQHMAEADYQIRASNQEWPRARPGGVFGGSGAHIKLGRYFNGSSANSGPWSEPSGFRTMIHEFGHYGLWLYDSYFYYGGATKVPSSCTSPDIVTNTTYDSNATIMDYQRNSSELAMEDVEGLWSKSCYDTHQYQQYGMSDWEAVADRFDRAGVTMHLPSAVVVGPAAIPVSAWSVVTTAPTHNAGACLVPPTVRLASPDGTPMVFAVVLRRAGGQVIAQGLTDKWGRIQVLGGGEGDQLIFRQSWPPSSTRISGSALMTCDDPRTILTGTPPLYLDFSAEPGPAANQVEIEITASGAVQGLPIVTVYQTGAAAGVEVSMGAGGPSGTFTGTASLSAALPLEGKAVVSATGAAGTAPYIFSFAIETIAAGESATLWSLDGQAELYLPAGSLPGGARVTIQPANVATLAAGSLAAQAVGTELVPLVGPFRVTSSSGDALSKGASLSLFYSDASGLAPGTDPTTARIYRWTGGQWVPLESAVDQDHRYVSATLSDLGTYALWAEASWRTYVPLLAK